MVKGLLVVEGPDDKHVMYSLFAQHSIDFKKYFEVTDLGGIDNILDGIKTTVKAASRVAILVDADIELRDRWISLRDRVRSIGFDMPDEPNPMGTVVENAEGDRIGVWLMPNNVLPGMLEDFLTLIVPDNDQLLDHVKIFIDNLPEIPGRFNSVHRAKAIIYTYLAIRDEPGLRFATAVKAKHFDAHKPDAVNLLAWVQKVLVA